MRVAVTGANGLLGAHVVRALLEAGHRPVAVVRERADLRGLTGVEVPLARADTRSRDDLMRAFDGAEVVVHCAAVYSYSQDAARLERANVDGTRRVMAAASEAGVRRVVLTSSSVTCGSSAGPQQRDETGAIEDEWVPAYFRTKVRQEQVAAEVAETRGLELIVTCPTVVLGDRTGGWCRAMRCWSATCSTPTAPRSPVAATWPRPATSRAGTSCSPSTVSRGNAICSAARTSAGERCTPLSRS